MVFVWGGGSRGRFPFLSGLWVDGVSSDFSAKAGLRVERKVLVHTGTQINQI